MSRIVEAMEPADVVQVASTVVHSHTQGQHCVRCTSDTSPCDLLTWAQDLVDRWHTDREALRKEVAAW